MKLSATITGAIVFAALPLCASDRYKIDPQHTKVGFSVPHIVISTVEGRFKDFEGVILLDTQNMTKSSVEITINTDSIDTGVAKRDSDLHHSELLDVGRYPHILFKSTKIEKRGSQWVAIGRIDYLGRVPAGERQGEPERSALAAALPASDH